MLNENVPKVLKVLNVVRVPLKASPISNFNSSSIKKMSSVNNRRDEHVNVDNANDADNDADDFILLLLLLLLLLLCTMHYALCAMNYVLCTVYTDIK